MSLWYSGPATISQGGNEVAVECEIAKHQQMIPAGDELLEGLISWDGTWWDPNPPFTLEIDEATIRLDNGGEGQILVNHMQTGMPSGEHGTFAGNGGLPA